MKLATLPANFKTRSILHIASRIHFITFVRTSPIVSKGEISYNVCTFIVRKFQNFTIIVDQIENTAKMDNYYIHQPSISNVNVTAWDMFHASFQQAVIKIFWPDFSRFYSRFQVALRNVVF